MSITADDVRIQAQRSHHAIPTTFCSHMHTIRTTLCSHHAIRTTFCSHMHAIRTTLCSHHVIRTILCSHYAIRTTLCSHHAIPTALCSQNAIRTTLGAHHEIRTTFCSYCKGVMPMLKITQCTFTSIRIIACRSPNAHHCMLITAVNEVMSMQ